MASFVGNYWVARKQSDVAAERKEGRYKRRFFFLRRFVRKRPSSTSTGTMRDSLSKTANLMSAAGSSEAMVMERYLDDGAYSQLLLRSRLFRLERLVHSPRFILAAVLLLVFLVLLNLTLSKICALVEKVLRYHLYSNIFSIVWGWPSFSLLKRLLW